MKYLYLLLLIPLLFLDIALEILYIWGLEPDIITSCCAVVFGDSAGGGTNLLSGFSHEVSMWLFYCSVLALVMVGLFLLVKWHHWTGLLFSSGWLWFFLLALTVVTSEFSSYVYAMPFHKCPFCILKPEYHYIGFFIYSSLFLASFLGMCVIVVEPLRSLEGLNVIVTHFQKSAIKISLLFLLAFTCLSSYHYLKYMLIGGEG